MNTLCPYCGVGCGLKIEGAKIKGDPMHPSSKGDVCKKPLYLVDALNKERLTEPLYRENKAKEFRQISWDEAYTLLADKLNSNLPDENYFYLSGQLLTEESYAINKFVKGFMGTNNVDANSRLCMASAVVAHKMAFGSDGPLASYEDIDDSDLFVFAGSNAALAHPVVFKRVLKRKRAASVKIIVLDPVCTETAQRADIYIPINAGTDTAFFNCVLALLGGKDGEAMKEAQKYDIEKTASICGIQKEQIKEFTALFRDANKVLSFWCQGLNQSTNGVAKNLSLINLHIATGRLGKRGAPFSLTGQSNAMGGREVGYLSNGLPGYRDVRNKEDRSFIESFWKTPAHIQESPGITVTKAIDEIIDGKIKLFWSVYTNPAVSLPNLNKVFKAFLKKELFLVVQDAYMSDSCKYANLILPAAQWGEKEGTMTNSERMVTRLRKAFAPPKNAKTDSKIFCELAQKMGYKGFEYKESKEIFEEFALSTRGRLCDISEFSYETLPRRWGAKHLYEKGFDKEPIMCPTPYLAPRQEMGYEFIMTTGRLKNQWHTMTRTGKSEELLKDKKEPYCLICEADAKRLGVNDGDKKRIISRVGKLKTTFRIGEVKEGHIFMPFGWEAKKGGLGAFFGVEAWEGAVNTVMNDDVDPLSFQPELKFARVKIV